MGGGGEAVEKGGGGDRRETNMQTDRQTDRDRQTETERQRETETERQRGLPMYSVQSLLTAFVYFIFIKKLYDRKLLSTNQVKCASDLTAVIRRPCRLARHLAEITTRKKKTQTAWGYAAGAGSTTRSWRTAAVLDIYNRIQIMY